MNELQNYIRTYLGVANEDLEKVQGLFFEQEIKKGGYFCKAGQYCDKLSFVKSGYLRFYANAEGKEVTQWLAGPGYFATDLGSFIFDERSRWTIHALSDCSMFTIQLKDYRRLEGIISNWQQLENRFISSCFIALENRVFRHLSLQAEERYDLLFSENKELFQQVPQQYIASMLGMSPETFSRIRAKKLSWYISSASLLKALTFEYLKKEIWKRKLRQV